MKKILIHIGMGRCGSSSIQHALTINRSELEANRILYPAIDIAYNAQHSLSALKDEYVVSSVQYWLETLDEFEKSECSTLLISSENLTHIAQELFDAIKQLLSGYSVKIIFITRNQRELLPSIYAQWTKAGIIFRSFKHFYQVTKQEWHFTAIVERWAVAYGRENVLCAALGPKGDSVQAFIACCGERDLVEILEKTHPIRVNKSINQKLLAILVLFERLNRRNKIGSVFPGWNRIETSQPERNAGLRKKLVQYLELYSERWCKGGGWKLPKEVAAEISDEYRETNRCFHTTYINHRPKDWFN